MKLNNKWFTLIELLVSISILWIVMVSVFAIFFLSNDLNNKIDVSRSLQENIKNITEIISDDVKRNWIIWVQNGNIWDKCDFDISQKFKRWMKICTKSLNDYYLAKDNFWTYTRVLDYKVECSKEWSMCVLVKNDWNSITPISNSWVEFKNFYVTLSWDEKLPLLNINFTLEPSSKKWIKPNLIKESKINFQTTISWNFYGN